MISQSVDQIIQKKNLVDQPSLWSAWSVNQLIRSVDRIIQKMIFILKNCRIFYQLVRSSADQPDLLIGQSADHISWSDHSKKCFSLKKNRKKFISWSDHLLNRSADQLLSRSFKKCFSFHFFLRNKVFWKKNYQLIRSAADQPDQLISQIGSAVQVKSASHIRLVIQLRSAHLHRIRSNF